MSPEEYHQGILAGTLPRYDKAGNEVRETIAYPPTMTEMQGDQPVRKVPRFPEASTSATEKRNEEPPPAYYLLTQAADIVAGDRHVQHGPKERNFENIAILWRAYMRLKAHNEPGYDISAFDVATMMELLKIARRFAGSGRTNPDNYVDGAGYCAIAGEIALGEFPHKRKPGENPSF